MMASANELKHVFFSKWDHGTLERKEAFQLLLEKREELYEKLQADGENPYVNTSKEKDELISGELYENLKPSTSTHNFHFSYSSTNETGLFLVRLSERNNGYVITLLHKDEIKNYKIEKIVSHFPVISS
jgi:hypothetical protein